MRLFVAVDLEPPVRREVAVAVGRLARALATPGRHDGPRIAWVREENLHLTMKFLGEVPERRAEALADRFVAPLAVRAFDMELGGVGVFPPVGAPRVVWVGIARGTEHLFALASQVEEQFVAWGFDREARPFQAHLTVGRCKDAMDRTARERMLGTEVRNLGVTRVDAVVLYESRLSATGPTYVPLARAPLST